MNKKNLWKKDDRREWREKHATSPYRTRTLVKMYKLTGVPQHEWDLTRGKQYAVMHQVIWMESANAAATAIPWTLRLSQAPRKCAMGSTTTATEESTIASRAAPPVTIRRYRVIDWCDREPRLLM